jgi:hypothetical protein
VNAIRGDFTNLVITADLNLTDVLSNLTKPVPGGVPPTRQPASSSAGVPGAGG